jgi:hypothetical protein
MFPGRRSFAQCVETKGGTGPLVGVARYDETLLTAAESGVGGPLAFYPFALLVQYF